MLEATGTSYHTQLNYACICFWTLTNRPKRKACFVNHQHFLQMYDFKYIAWCSCLALMCLVNIKVPIVLFWIFLFATSTYITKSNKHWIISNYDTYLSFIFLHNWDLLALFFFLFAIIKVFKNNSLCFRVYIRHIIKSYEIYCTHKKKKKNHYL